MIRLLVCMAAANTATAAVSATKEAAVESVDTHGRELIGLSDRIWAYAETALEEHKSAAELADYAEQQGFKVERGISDMPTAFVASYGSGRPIIGVMGEYDALPGISQKALPEKTPLEVGRRRPWLRAQHVRRSEYRRGRRHQGADRGREVQGYDSLLRHAGRGGRGGQDLHGARRRVRRHRRVLAWHPGDITQADTTSSQAMVDLVVEFEGRTAHAASDPWNGRSAVDALELFTDGINMMREHIKPTSRMHYAIMAGGDVPNVVPDYAKLWLWLRDWKRSEVDDLLARTRKLAEGAALMTETTSKLTVQGGSWEILTNCPVRS